MTSNKKAEKPFKPRPGQTDYTNIRYCPVVQSVIVNGDKVLMMRRNDGMRLYPGVWSGISGFLDDHGSVEEKIQEELREEVGIQTADILEIQRGGVVLQEAPEYGKTWLVVVLKVVVKTDNVKLNWEASETRWLMPHAAKRLNLLPGYLEVLETFFP